MKFEWGVADEWFGEKVFIQHFSIIIRFSVSMTPSRHWNVMSSNKLGAGTMDSPSLLLLTLRDALYRQGELSVEEMQAVVEAECMKFATLQGMGVH